ncbi:MAG: class I SAM-dependent rRNA methyltransferase [Treponema sp.]|jgi:23S rRNA (cytosine1962-C5)-methyltransferase|nr:class I SAM-dependent rRNA methyltransferase [Treponema sp.]
MKRIILKAGEERRIQQGHPWIYRSEVQSIVSGTGPSAAGAELEPGECADVESSPRYTNNAPRPHPEYLGRAIVNPESQIIARIYSPSKEGLDKGFFKRRIREALERRLDLGINVAGESCRIVFGEADFLPGLIVDRFVGSRAAESSVGPAAESSTEPAAENSDGLQSWLSVQFLAKGMDIRRDIILEALEEVLSSPVRPGKAAPGSPEGIIEKSAPVRELEGLPLYNGLVKGAFPENGIVICENGILFYADLTGGQKTGHFLDQKDNRRLTAEYAAVLAKRAAERREASSGNPAAAPLRILDCFCYSGGFGIHAAKAAAPHCPVKVTAVDVSAPALELVRKNAGINGAADIVETVEADVFEFLHGAGRQKQLYDLIILDPPAFAKNRAALDNALAGYKEINLRAIKLLVNGGILASSSCSHAVNENRFRRMIAQAAADSGRRLVQLEFRGQAKDHPVLCGYDESSYLKCGFYRVIG